MPIYQLDPINFDSENWKASSHRGACIVRADHEQAARTCAQLELTAAFAFKPGNKMPISPWMLPEETSCKELTDHKFEVDGPDEVLEPASKKPEIPGSVHFGAGVNIGDNVYAEGQPFPPTSKTKE